MSPEMEDVRARLTGVEHVSGAGLGSRDIGSDDTRGTGEWPGALLALFDLRGAMGRRSLVDWIGAEGVDQSLLLRLTPRGLSRRNAGRTSGPVGDSSIESTDMGDGIARTREGRRGGVMGVASNATGGAVLVGKVERGTIEKKWSELSSTDRVSISSVEDVDGMTREMEMREAGSRQEGMQQRT